MAKVLQQEIQVKSKPLGLSYNANVTVLDNGGVKQDEAKEVINSYVLSIKLQEWNQLVLRGFKKRKVDKAELTARLPIMKGERISRGITTRGKRRLLNACRYFDHIYISKAGKKMITLSYGDISISYGKDCKKDLDRFLKRLKAYFDKMKWEHHYVWVAEIQEKRLARTGVEALHFHIVTPHFVPKELINKWWNNAVNKPRKKAGLSTQTLLPNITGSKKGDKIKEFGGYIAKYLSKEGHKIKGNGYNMSQATSKALIPTINKGFNVTEKQIEDIWFKAISDNGCYKKEHCFEDGNFYRLFACANPLEVELLVKELSVGQENEKWYNDFLNDLQNSKPLSTPKQKIVKSRAQLKQEARELIKEQQVSKQYNEALFTIEHDKDVKEWQKRLVLN